MNNTLNQKNLNRLMRQIKETIEAEGLDAVAKKVHTSGNTCILADFRSDIERNTYYYYEGLFIETRMVLGECLSFKMYQSFPKALLSHSAIWNSTLLAYKNDVQLNILSTH